MQKTFEIEMVHNGIVIREDGYTEAVLYNEDTDTKEELDAEYSDYKKKIGAIVTDEIFGEFSELSKESKLMYEKTNKQTFGYRIEMKITPLSKGEFKL